MTDFVKDKILARTRDQWEGGEGLKKVVLGLRPRQQSRSQPIQETLYESKYDALSLCIVKLA